MTSIKHLLWFPEHDVQPKGQLIIHVVWQMWSGEGG